ncbi:hypothetical protein bmyco0002_51080 [Bacillus pseudomycoides]|nr:hypothetical protein bmyco0002_51080 [Bacillus pseudomycoides]
MKVKNVSKGVPFDTAQIISNKFLNMDTVAIFSYNIQN